MKRLMDFPVILFLALTLDRAVLTAGYILLFGFGLALNAAHAFGEAPCQVADPVRLQLNGIEYRIPAALQPYYSPERALATRDYFPKGVRTRQYCQSPQSPPAVVDSISFPRNSLIAWAREDVDRAELVSIFPLAIKRSLRSDFAVAEGGQTTPDGLFRKIVRGARFEIISIEPMFFGHDHLCRLWSRWDRATKQPMYDLGPAPRRVTGNAWRSRH